MPLSCVTKHFKERFPKPKVECFETSVTVHQSTQCNNLADLNLQLSFLYLSVSTLVSKNCPQPRILSFAYQADKSVVDNIHK